MSASTSCSERARAALSAIRRGEGLPVDVARSLGEECAPEFFRIVVEALADSFLPAEAAAYERLMRAWVPEARVGTVYVLSRVTLGADIKITSVVLDAMKTRFPGARVVLVGGRKSAELFAADTRMEHLEVNYPRSGPVSERIAFAQDLRTRLEGPDRIVVDPDSRITQLGLLPLCEPGRYFHFPSRAAGGDTEANLSQLTARWLEATFGASGNAWIAPHAVPVESDRPFAAVNLGVGENDAKRLAGDFESRLIRILAERFETVWVDRGAGGAEGSRVTAAVEASGAGNRVRFWEGSFAGFASIIARSALYVGYDSAGQHAAAACGIPLITIFAGSVSARFRNRWAPWGSGPVSIIDADELTPDAVLNKIETKQRSFSKTSNAENHGGN